MLHEASHILSSREFATEPIATGPIALEAFDRFDEHLPDSPNSGTDATVPFNFHDAVFIRCCAHLANRAKRWGYVCPVDDMFGGRRYGLSPAKEYVHTLRADFILNPSGEIGEVTKTRPPQGFIDLWRRDVKKWYCEIPGEPTAEQEAAALSALKLYQPVVGF